MLYLVSLPHPGGSGYFWDAASWGPRWPLRDCSCALQSPVGWKAGLFLHPSLPGLATSWGHGAVPELYLGDFVRLCIFYLMGGEPGSFHLFFSERFHPILYQAGLLSSGEWELFASSGQGAKEWP